MPKSSLPISAPGTKNEQASSSRDEVFLKKIRECLRENLSNKAFSVEALAERVHLSSSQLNRRLNRLIGCPAGRLIREYRLWHASQLLAGDTGTVYEIAFAVGFSDQAHFCRAFKQIFGCTPSSFAKDKPVEANRSIFMQ